MTFLRRVILLLAGLTLAGFAYQRWAERRDMRLSPAPGVLVPVGGRRLHAWCTGHGRPAVILLSGDGTPSVTMYPTQRRIAAFTTVCSYDRAGLGWSDAAERPMSLPDQVDDLQQVVGRLGLRPPFVLVPESGGSLIALSLFRRSPGSVGGMVMVDGSEPDLWFRGAPDEFASMRLMDPLWQVGWHLGAVRLLLPYAVPAWVDALPPADRALFDAAWSKPMPGQARDAIDRWEQTASADRSRATPGLLGSRPLVVIRHGLSGGMGVPAKYEAEWPDAQERLARLSTSTRVVVARGNHHLVAEENPELVAGQVQTLVEQLRSKEVALRFAPAGPDRRP